MKKMFISSSVVILFLFTGCIAGPKTFSLLKDDKASSVKYSKTEMYAGVLEEPHMNHFKSMGRQSIVEDDRLSAVQKRKLINEIESIKYEKNRFFNFTMVYNQPFLDDELTFSFEIMDDKNRKYFESFSIIPIKTTFISQYGSRYSYNYTYVIKTKQSLKKTVNYKLYVRFPDRKMRIYRIDLL